MILDRQTSKLRNGLKLLREYLNEPGRMKPEDRAHANQVIEAVLADELDPTDYLVRRHW